METTPLATILDSIHEQTDLIKLFDTISEMRKQCNEPSMASYGLVNTISDYVINRPKVLEYCVGNKQFIKDFAIEENAKRKYNF